MWLGCSCDPLLSKKSLISTITNMSSGCYLNSIPRKNSIKCVLIPSIKQSQTNAKYRLVWVIFATVSVRKNGRFFCHHSFVHSFVHEKPYNKKICHSETSKTTFMVLGFNEVVSCFILKLIFSCWVLVSKSASVCFSQCFPFSLCCVVCVSCVRSPWFSGFFSVFCITLSFLLDSLCPLFCLHCLSSIKMSTVSLCSCVVPCIALTSIHPLICLLPKVINVLLFLSLTC